jgi:hypothetical protein
MVQVEYASNLYRWIKRPNRALTNVSLTIETGKLVTVSTLDI